MKLFLRMRFYPYETRRALTERENALRHSGRRIEQLKETPTNRLGMIGYLRRIFRWPRLHPMRLDPIQDIEAVNGQFHSIGDNPQFILHSTVGRLPAGWVEISYLAWSSERWMHPTLYVDTGNGFSEEQAISLICPVRVEAISIKRNNGSTPTNSTVTPTADVRLHFLVCLPNDVRALRLDPLSSRGSFVLQTLSFQELGGAGVVLAVLRHHLKSVWRQPWLLQRVAHYAWQTVQAEGVFGLRRYFLPQGQTDTEAYEQWVRIYDTLTDGDRSAIRQLLCAYRISHS